MTHTRGKNWAGNIPIEPARTETPATDEAVAEVLQRSAAEGNTVRVVGKAHTCSDLIRVEGNTTLLSLDNLKGIQAIDQGQQTVTVRAGTELSKLNRELWEHGFSLENLGDIDEQAVAGCISTSTHGSGSALGSVSTQVVGMTLVTADGSKIECSETEERDVFKAAQVSIGCLGVITSLTLKLEPAYKLHMVTERRKRDEVLARIDDLLEQYRHVECWVWPDTRYVSLRVANKTDKPVSRSPAVRFLKHTLLENAALWLVSSLCLHFPSWSDEISALSAFLLKDDEVDHSYRVLATPRWVKYLEMEYVVPADQGPACLAEIMKMHDERPYPVNFPIHYRYVDADDIFLSPFHGRRSASIDVQQFKGIDYLPYFRESEKIFRKYEGRPHWGKMHFLTAKELEPMYPRWNDFLSVRAKLDPSGLFLSPHLRKLLGV